MVQQATLPRLVRGQWLRMTWEEFLEWAPDEGQSEWVDGKGIAYVSNSTRHVDVEGFLLVLLRHFVLVYGLGRVFASAALMRDSTRPAGRMPDVLVVRTENLNRIHNRWVDGPADLAVELISEDSVRRDTIDKFDEYRRLGVKEYLLIDTRPGQQHFQFFRLDPDGKYREIEPDSQGRYHSEVLPGFWLDPTWFQQDPLPNPLVLLRRISPDAWQRIVSEVEADS
jgi:Uma2 family endonuclease